MNKLRVVLGLLIAPTTLPIAYTALGLCCSGYAYQSLAHMDKFAATVPAITVASYGASLLFGVPLLLLLHRSGRFTFIWCVTSAAILGAFGAVAVFSILDGELNAEWTIWGLGAVIALVTAAVFSLIAGIPAHGAQQAVPADGPASRARG